MPTLKQKLEMAQALEVKDVKPKKKRNYPKNRKPATKKTTKKDKNGNDAK